MTELLTALLVTLIAYEAKAWFPCALKLVVAVAVSRLPKSQRDRFREEWLGHLESVPGGVARAIHAGGFILASGRMFPRWHRAVRFRRSMARGRFASRVTTRALDIAFAAFSLALFAPLMVILATVLRLQGGPPIFKQRRLGRGGRPFYIYTFRTVSPANERYLLARVSTVGQFMRRASLDELPQLINVLRGDMSVVGPRPSAHEMPTAKPGLNGGWCYQIEWKTSEPQPVYRWVAATISGYFYSVLYGLLTALGRPPKSDEN